MSLKCKRYTKHGKSFVLVNSLKNQSVNAMAYNLINEDKVTGLLSLEVIKKHNRFDMLYNVSGLVTLREFLITPLTKNTFCELLEGILETLKSMQEYHIGDYQTLLLDFDYVYINPSSRRVQFLYLPIAYYKNGENFKDFLGHIISRGTFIHDADNEYVSKFVALINDHESFNLVRLEEYVSWIKTGKGNFDNDKPKCRRCNNLLTAADAFCPTCGMKVTISDERFEYVPVLDSGSENIVPLSSVSVINQEKVASQAFIVRIQDGIRVDVNKEEFLIGKSEQCDLIISGNASISRTHAKIVQYENRFYLVDLGSTNGTRIDDEVVPENKFVELSGDTRFFLSNEEFYFDIERG